MPPFFHDLNYEPEIDNFHQKFVTMVKILKFCSLIEFYFQFISKIQAKRHWKHK